MQWWIYVVLRRCGLAGFLVPRHLDRRKTKPLIEMGRLAAISYLSNHDPAEHRDIAAGAIDWRSPNPPTSAASGQRTPTPASQHD